MERSSPFAQRLKSIAARRKLHELILNTRLDLEQEKLRAQRLKRKSLREQWLMEGTSASPDDRDPLRPLREAESRIEELQQTLNSLQVQMQQLDNLETWKVPQEPPSREPLRGGDGAGRSPDGHGKVDGTALPSSEGRSGAESALKPAPDSPRKPRSAEARESLQNGETQDGDLSGNECGPEETNVKAIPEAAEKGDHRPPGDGSGSASAVNPAGQGLDPGKAPAGRQRKLAVEEMVIRDHLGQEVGCMDALGQNRRSLEKEEELAGHTNLEGGCESGGRPGPVDGVMDHKEALGEGPLDRELGRRDGPEGGSPTSQNHAKPSDLLQKEDGYPKGQEDGPLEVGSLAKEEHRKEEGGQKEVPEQGAQEMPALALATDDAPSTESVKQSQGNQTEMPEWQESGSTQEGEGWAEFPHGSQARTQTLEDPGISPPPEGEPLAPEHFSPSWPETRKTITQQGGELLRQEGEGRPPSPIPSLTNHLSSLPGPVVSLQDATISASEESPVATEVQTPGPPEAQVRPRPDSDVFLPDEIPPSAEDPGVSPIPLQDQIPPTLQGTEPSPPVGVIPTFSWQEVDGALPDEIQTSLPSPTSPNLPEEEGSSPDRGALTSEEQSTSSLLGQTPSSQEAAKSLPGDRDTSGPPEERSPLAEQTPSSNKAQSPMLLDASICPNALSLSSPETLRPLLDETEGVKNRDAEESGNAGIGSAGAGEIAEVLENLGMGSEGAGEIAEVLENLGVGSEGAGEIAEVLENLGVGSERAGEIAEVLENLGVGSEGAGEIAEVLENLGVGSEGAGEIAEVLENLTSERQPLLKEARVSGASLDIPVGDPQFRSGNLKSQVAMSQRVPNDSPRTSATAASSLPPQADLPRQGEDQDPERNKRKPRSCQCCILM